MAKKGKGKGKGKGKAEKQTQKKTKQTKKSKKVEVTQLKCKKADSQKEIDPVTGTRFKSGTSKQLALELIVEACKEGKNQSEIRKALTDYRKENGKKRSLDAGYLAFCVATHPEFFETKSDGSIKQVKEFKPDPEAQKKLEEKKQKRQAKKEKRKGKSKPKKGGKKGKKPTLKK